MQCESIMKTSLDWRETFLLLQCESSALVFVSLPISRHIHTLSSHAVVFEERVTKREVVLTVTHIFQI